MCFRLANLIKLARDVIKLFMSVIYKFLYQARAFVPDKPFQPSLMFVGKARILTKSEAPRYCLTRKQYTRLERLARDKHYSSL